MTGKFTASARALLLLSAIAIQPFIPDRVAEAAEAANACTLPNPVTSSITLNASCHYPGPLMINTSGVTVDCKGAFIDARGANNGILVKGMNVQGVTIRNCTVEGARRQGVMLEQPTNDRDMAKRPFDERYKIALDNIRLDNITVINSASVGIYVDSYAENVQITNSKVLRSGGAAIYLEHSSRYSTISGNVLTGNGFGDPLGRRKSGQREAIAVDSSAFNVIEGNTFSSNAAGGVFFYKNCWERHSKPGTVRRWQHSAHNLVEGNVFENEKIGVWIASRQTRNLSKWDCGDPAVAPGFYRDYANDNQVVGNRFISTGVGVRINDDDAKIIGNTFIDAQSGCVELGSLRQDEVMKRPVQGTQLTGNICSLAPAASVPQDEPLPKDRGFREIGRSDFAVCQSNELDNKSFACQ